jgi:hypothetical protein
MSAIKRTLQEPADEVRRIEVERLDKLMLSLWPEAQTGNIKAIETILGIMARRAKLLGLDAPTEITGAFGGPITIRIIYPNEPANAD